MKKINNPLAGKMFFDKQGNLYVKNGIKFGGQMNPKVSPREWFYLMFETAKESYEKIDPSILKNFDWKKDTLGSPVTQWRTRKKLIEKGYLI